MTTLKIDLAARLARMTKRERVILGVGLVSFVLFVITLIGMWLSSSLKTMERTVNDKAQKLEILMGQREKYEFAKLQRREIEDILQQGNAVQLIGAVESVAVEMGIAIDNMQPRGETVDQQARVREEKVEVNVRRITIDRLVDFLRQLEARSRTVAIRNLKINKSFQQPDHLEVNFTVANFKPLEAAAEPASSPPAENAGASAPKDH